MQTKQMLHNLVHLVSREILVRFELFISTERSLRTIRQLTNLRLYELTNVCEGVTGDQAESVRKHFATPAGFLHRR